MMKRNEIHGNCAHVLLELLGIENHLHFRAVLTPQSQTLTWTEILGRLKVEGQFRGATVICTKGCASDPLIFASGVDIYIYIICTP